MICEKCKYQKECVFRDLSDLAEAETCKRFVHITNFNNVTASPKVLAKFIYDAIDYVCSHEQCFVANNCHGKGCIECITEWLEQEAKNEK